MQNYIFFSYAWLIESVRSSSNSCFLVLAWLKLTTGLSHSWNLLEIWDSPGNSWNNFFFFNFPWKSTGKSQRHQVLWFLWVLWKSFWKMVLPRIMSRMGSLITFQHCHSLVNLTSVWSRISDKIKHCREWFLW